LDTWTPSPGVQPGRIYGRAPIAQAVIEFGVANRHDLTVDDLAQLPFADYEGAASIVEVSGEFSYVDGEVVGSTTGAPVGTGYANEKDDRTLQATLNKFAFVWRGPYTTWDEFIAEALAELRVYREACGSVTVEWIGLRYVNRIQMPRRSIEIRDYLRTSIEHRASECRRGAAAGAPAGHRRPIASGFRHACIGVHGTTSGASG
jgi:uncharacterized protein (TIGR04255 family)